MTITMETGFWTDSSVDGFVPEEKLFYFVLLSNDRITNTGCYEITIHQISGYTGLSQECVKVLLDRFEKVYKKIMYCNETHELLILNWGKHHWTTSPTYISALIESTQFVKNEVFREFLMDQIENPGSAFNMSKKEVTAAGKKAKKPRNTLTMEIDSTVFFPDDAYVEDAFHRYIEHRKKISKPIKTMEMANSAKKTLIDRCSHNGVFYADFAAGMLQTSIDRGWMGIPKLDWSGIPKIPWTETPSGTISWGCIS